jgi:ribosomal protein S18 acetylase RimI-like enzyme
MLRVLPVACGAGALLLFHIVQRAERRRVRVALHGKLLEAKDDGSDAVFALFDTRTRVREGGLSDRGVAQLIARAFVGTNTAEPEWGIHWLLGPQLGDRADRTGERLQIVTFFMTFALKANAIYPTEGAVLGSKDDEGEVAAINVVRVFRGGYAKQFWEFLWETRIVLGEMLAGTVPKVYMDSDQKTLRGHIDARVKKMFDQTLLKLHAQHVPGPHYYVAVMATIPEKQGQGHCGKLMRAISRAADQDRLPCYLECTSERNCKIYQRFGYRVVGQYTVSIENDEPGSAPFEHLYCMLRPPK